MESLIPDLQNIVYKYVHEIMMRDIIPDLIVYENLYYISLWDDDFYCGVYPTMICSKVIQVTPAQRHLMSQIKEECDIQKKIDNGFLTSSEALIYKQEILDNYGRYRAY